MSQVSVAYAQEALPDIAALSESKRDKLIEHLDRGRILYQEKLYDRALVSFEDAYAIYPHPDVRYKIAECQEMLGQTEKAAQSYRDVLNRSAEDAPDRDKLSVKVAELDAVLAKKEAEEISKKNAELDKKQAEESAKNNNDSTTSESDLPIVPLAVGGVGAVSAVAAITFWALYGGVNSDIKDYDTQKDNTGRPTNYNDLVDSRSTYGTFAIATTTIAVAALSTAAVLWIMDSETKEEPAPESEKEGLLTRRLILAPWFSDKGSGLGFVATF